MAKFEEIKKAILEVAGNPESGVVRQYADKWAEAIVALDEETPQAKPAEKNGAPFERPTKETRVTKPTEIR